MGDCGACWAFAATGALEALMARTTKNLVPLSEQNLIDCSDDNGNKGCNGGSPDRAFEYVITNQIHSDECYPYKNRTEACKKPSASTVGKCDDFNTISGEICIQNFVGKTGPIAVTMLAPPSFKKYSGGIIDDPNGCGNDANHSALIVGYGYDNSKETPYWIIKNSWGAGWGDNGYMKVVRNKGMCGIGRFATYPIANDSTSSYGSSSVIYILLMRLLINFLQ